MIVRNLRRRKWLLLAALMIASALTVLAQTPFGTPYTPGAPPPSPTPVCATAPPTRLIVRERARVSSIDNRPLNVREGAGTTFAISGQIEPGRIVFVLEGAVCSARYAWYRVALGSLEGWIAEGDASGYFIAPYPPG